MANHTPEPWRTHSKIQTAIYGANHTIIADTMKVYDCGDMDKANAHRIVAAVNFLEGIPNEQLNGNLRAVLSELYEELFRAYVDPDASVADALQAVKDGLGEVLELIGVDAGEIEAQVIPEFKCDALYIQRQILACAASGFYEFQLKMGFVVSRVSGLDTQIMTFEEFLHYMDDLAYDEIDTLVD